ncbi:MAG: ATP-dependent RecD-like DNA helicase [Nannocystaceae bacterium]
MVGGWWALGDPSRLVDAWAVREGTKAAPGPLCGVVARAVYFDARTGYTVVRLRVPDELALITAVGRSNGVDEGSELALTGEWVSHPEHGRQFQFERLQTRLPTTLAGIRRRLMRYPGLREVMAERIVERFGHDTLEIMEKDARRLLEVAGIGPRTFQRIDAYHRTQVGHMADLENRLVELGLSPRLAYAIHRRYRADALAMIEHHPYLLAREVHGIGFLTADRMARALGVDMESDERCEAGVLFALERAGLDGHCALPVDRLSDAATAVLGLGAERVAAAIEVLAADTVLVIEERDGENAPLCFPRGVVQAETHVARSLSELAVADHDRWEVGRLPDELSAGQAAAVRAIADNGVVILTGGPGTGKSTVMRHVIGLARRYAMEPLLAAPTGRAAKRLEQATEMPAKTVHRLLEIQGNSGQFHYHANHPLPPGLVVIDETSMLDLKLAEALFSALTPQHRLMLVGDAEQLPSVGPGNVLRDLIDAHEGEDTPVEVVRLNKIFRQAEGSSIVVNAHRVLHGEKLCTDEGDDGQFYVIPAKDALRAHDLIVRMASGRVPDVYALDPMSEIQVLCPMHKGQAGTEAFNRSLQSRYTIDNESLQVPSQGDAPPKLFFVGDRVMQTRNDYERNVFNGDIGVVTSVRPEAGTLSVEIDGESVEYGAKELVALALAYAISIHKSQGSEFPAVLIPILAEHQVMLRRNLLYTAMTRARKLCVIVGDPRAIDRAIWKGDAASRFTGLRKRLKQALADALGDTTYAG